MNFSIFNRIQRYIFLRFFLGFWGSILLVLNLYTVSKVIERLGDFLKENSPLNFNEILLYVVYEYPLVIVYGLTFSVAIAAVYTLGKANEDRELISFYNSGYSIFFVMRPIFIFVALICVAYSLLEDSFVYNYHQKHLILHNKLYKRKASQRKIRVNFALFGSENKIYFIGVFRPSEFKLQNTQIIYLEKKETKFKKVLSMDSMTYNYKSEKWEASNIIVNEWNEDGSILTRNLDSMELELNEKPNFFELEQWGNEHLSSTSIRKIAEKKIITGGNADKYYSTSHLKQSILYLPMLIVFLAIPLSRFSRRANLIIYLFLILVVAFFYYVIAYIGVSLGAIGLLPPVIAGWFGIIVLGLLIAKFVFIKKI